MWFAWKVPYFRIDIELHHDQSSLPYRACVIAHSSYFTYVFGTICTICIESDGNWRPTYLCGLTTSRLIAHFPRIPPLFLRIGKYEFKIGIAIKGHMVKVGS